LIRDFSLFKYEFRRVVNLNERDFKQMFAVYKNMNN